MSSTVVRDARGDDPPGERVGTPTISVVICAYTMARWDDVLAAVESVRLQRRPADELLLVIDHCPELSARLAAELPALRLLENPDRPGLSGARNAGVAAARCEVVAFLDDDAAAEPDWTERLAAAYRDPRVLGVGGRVQPRWDGERPSWFPREFDWVVGCSYRGLPEEPGPIRNFIGANMSFRRGELLAAGGFRTDLGRIGTRPLGCEETELCLRIAAGRPEGVLLYEPAARVRHHVPQARATKEYFRARCYAEGLSKASVARHAGAGRALSSERAYVRRTLPRAALGARPPVLRALCTGLGATAFGYAAGRIRQRRTGPDTAAANGPVGRTNLALSRFALPIALLLWLLTLPQVRLDAMGGLGLVQVLPVAYWVALALLTLGFCAALRRRRLSRPLLTGYLLALIGQIHATPALLYPELRYSWAWKHVAITDVLAHAGRLPALGGANLDVYHSWPGFFYPNAGIMHLLGLNSALSYAAWSPPVVNALLLFPLLVLFRCLGRSRRLAWAGVWTFYCFSWVGQDYYSPQAFAYVLYVVVLACVVRRLARGRSGWRWTAGMSVPVIVIAVSHPLTPLMLTGALAALALRRRYRPVVLPLLLISTAVTVGWDLSGGYSFVGPNMPALLHDLTQPFGNTGSGLPGQSNPTAAQIAIDWTDRALSGAALLMAATALVRFRSLRRGPLPLLLAAPLPWLALNNYGGEMAFRVYLFALPAMAYAAAALLFRPRRARKPRKAPVPLRLAALPMVLLVLLGAFSMAYYGKEKVNRFTPSETAAARWLAEHAPADAMLIGASGNIPYAYADYPHQTQLWLDQQPAADRQAMSADPGDTIALISGGGSARPTFLILTPSMQASIDADGSLPRGTVRSWEAGLAHDARYRVVHRTADAVVYRLLPGPAGGAP